MSREIKFRGWHAMQKEMVFSGLMPDMGFWKWVCYDSSTPFMQYTGLKDKNGVEIYEGDVVKISEGHPHWVKDNMEIVFTEGAFCLKPTGYDFNKGGKPVALITYGDQLQNNGFENNAGKYVEVIGNIYENPELLAL